MPEIDILLSSLWLKLGASSGRNQPRQAKGTGESCGTADAPIEVINLTPTTPNGKRSASSVSEMAELRSDLNRMHRERMELACWT